jgi:undecaprenyl-diphosphatase
MPEWLDSLLTLDKRLSQFFCQEVRSEPLQRWARWLSHTGDAWLWLVGSALLGIFFPNQRCRAIFVFVAILVVGGLVYLVKALVRRERPQPENGLIYRLTNGHSFPSGHAARGMLLVILAFQMQSSNLAVGLIPWAILISLARVVIGSHYASDVLAGWVIGLLGGLGFGALVSPFLQRCFNLL